MRTQMPLVVLLALAVACSSPQFDSTTWKQWSVASKGIPTRSRRQGMLSDLMSHRLRRGMPRKEVEALLGPPDQAPSGKFLYYVGASSGGLLIRGADYLVLVFDADGGLLDWTHLVTHSD